MKRKNGFNLMLFVFILLLIVIFSCAKGPEKVNDGILLQTDRDFSAMSVKEGMFKAFLFYIADDGVILRDNSYPATGRKKLMEYYSGRTDTGFVLKWEPLFAKIAGSGDLGYTYGVHTSTDKATGNVVKGTYVTIWQKQPEGSWKFVLDTGTQGLPQ